MCYFSSENDALLKSVIEKEAERHRAALLKMTAYVNQSFELSEVSVIDDQPYESNNTLEVASGRTMVEVNLTVEKKAVCDRNKIEQEHVKVPITPVVDIVEPIVQNSSVEATTCVPENCKKVKDAILQMDETKRVFDPLLKMKLRVFFGLIISLIVWAILQFGLFQ